MPTKYNKAHKLQPYVPAGREDGGEYRGDGFGGESYTPVRVKGQGSSIENKGQNQTITENNLNKNFDAKRQTEIYKLQKSTIDNLCLKSGGRTDKLYDTYSKTILECDPDNVEVLNNYLENNEKLKIKFGYAGRNAAGCAQNDGEIIANHDPLTIRHELGHTFDYFYGKNLPHDEISVMSGYSSMRFKDPETNKTMNETIHEELGVSMYKPTIKGWSLTYRKLGIDKIEKKREAAKKIQDIYYEYCDKYLDEFTGVKNAREKFRQLDAEIEFQNKELYRELQESEEFKQHEIAMKEASRAEANYSDEMIRKGFHTVIFSQSPEVMKAREKAKELYSKVEQKKKELMQKYNTDELTKQKWDILQKTHNVYQKFKNVSGVVGDTFDYLGTGGSFYTTNGHGSNYFNQRKSDGYVTEIFANMFDAYLRKDKEQWECLEKMFPATTKVFKKIYNLKKGK